MSDNAVSMSDATSPATFGWPPWLVSPVTEDDRKACVAFDVGVAEAIGRATVRLVFEAYGPERRVTLK